MSSDAVSFVSSHPRSILVTHRADGGIQASPLRVLVDGAGLVTATTRAVTAKARNLGRDPRYGLCVIDEGWSGPWMTIEGTAEILRLPDAMGALEAFFTARDGTIPDLDAFHETMEREQRVIVRFSIERATPAPVAR